MTWRSTRPPAAPRHRRQSQRRAASPVAHDRARDGGRRPVRRARRGATPPPGLATGCGQLAAAARAGHHPTSRRGPARRGTAGRRPVWTQGLARRVAAGQRPGRPGTCGVDLPRRGAGARAVGVGDEDPGDEPLPSAREPAPRGRGGRRRRRGRGTASVRQQSVGHGCRLPDRGSTARAITRSLTGSAAPRDHGRRAESPSASSGDRSTFPGCAGPQVAVSVGGEVERVAVPNPDLRLPSATAANTAAARAMSSSRVAT